MKTRMNRAASICVRFTFLFVLWFSVAAYGDDKIVEIDSAASLITIDQSGTRKTYRTKDFTKVTVNGTNSGLGQLRIGMTVSVTLADTQTISRIAAQGIVSSSAVTPTKPAPFFERSNPSATNRRVVIRARFEGADRIRLLDGKLWIEHVNSLKPDSFMINGIDWKPTWNGNVTEPFTDFKPPLAPIGQGRVALKQTAGRTKAQIEKAEGAKFEKTPTILIQDRIGGADFYEIELSW